MEDKQKCSELFELFTEISTEPRTWNEKAADTLADMIKQIIKCTRAISFVGSLYPLPPKVTWLWLCTYAYKVIINEFRVRKSRVNTHCYRSHVSQYQSLIQLQLMGL